MATFTLTFTHRSLRSIPRISAHPVQSTRCFSKQHTSDLILSRTVPTSNVGHIKILSLNRPAARNAISKQLLADLRSEIDSIRDEAESGVNNGTRALILASNVDTAFCAGADLKERKGMSGEETNSFLSTLRSTFALISQLPIPTISAVHGTALGGGLELSLTTHFRVFASTCSVGLPETRLAIIPGAGGTHRLPSIIGVNHARELILTGRRVAASEALRLGLCNRVIDIPESEDVGAAKEAVLKGAIAMAEQICEGGPVAVKAALRAVNSWQVGQEAENDAYSSILGTKDRLEALAAFAEKRKPAFKGE